MKFKCEVTINQAREKIAALYYDSEHFGEWQDGFLRIEAIDEYHVIYFKQGKGEMKLKETLIGDQLPFQKKARYDHAVMSNTLESKIEALGLQQCKITTEIDYFEIKSFSFRVLSKIAPSILKKPPQKWLNQFKQFAEQKLG